MEIMAWFPGFLAAIERSSVGDAVRLTPNLYPVLESLHVLGIALLVGSAAAVDLRLLGVGAKRSAGDGRGKIPAAALPHRFRSSRGDRSCDVHGRCTPSRNQRGGALEARPACRRRHQHRRISHGHLSHRRQVGHPYGDAGRGKDCRRRLGTGVDRRHYRRTVPGLLSEGNFRSTLSVLQRLMEHTPPNRPHRNPIYRLRRCGCFGGVRDEEFVYDHGVASPGGLIVGPSGAKHHVDL